MARLYIFAIGGTGSRVLKSLTMILAAGVKVDYEIVPIIIDPHVSNIDLIRTKNLLSTYQSITDKIGYNNGFFSNKISTLDKVCNETDGSFTFNLQEVSDTKFKDYIGYNELDEANQSLANILFSGKSIDKQGRPVNLLDVQMDIGFVGNPNIGSVVLDQFKNSKEFLSVANNFATDDRIFIISSIFGGTGAAGFPTILKNIRDAQANENAGLTSNISNSIIGALTVCPYFNVEHEKDSPIRAGDFVSKTKSALNYYSENINSNEEAKVNAMYYLSDNHASNPIPNDPGTGGQKNDAHLIELIAALSIIDFIETSDGLTTENGVSKNPVYKEFGLKVNVPNDICQLKFSDFHNITKIKIARKLAQLALFKKYIDDQLDNSIGKQVWSIDTPQINIAFKDGIFFSTHITDFLKAYVEWLDEMTRTGRGFSPLILNSELSSFVNGKPLNPKSRNPFKKSNHFDFDAFEGKLNSTVNGKTYQTAEHKLLNLFYDTTEQIVSANYGL